jgi:hypothetical protein
MYSFPLFLDLLTCRKTKPVKRQSAVKSYFSPLKIRFEASLISLGLIVTLLGVEWERQRAYLMPLMRNQYR